MNFIKMIRSINLNRKVPRKLYFNEALSDKNSLQSGTFRVIPMGFFKFHLKLFFPSIKIICDY